MLMTRLHESFTLGGGGFRGQPEGGGGSRSATRMGADLAWDREVSTGRGTAARRTASSPDGIQGLPGRRVREFGTLKALGRPSRKVTRQVVGESIVNGLIGGALGIGWASPPRAP